MLCLFNIFQITFQEEDIMSLIGKEVLPFEAKAFKNGEFIDVTNEDLKVNGAFSASIQRISLSFARLNLKIFKDNTLH